MGSGKATSGRATRQRETMPRAAPRMGPRRLIWIRVNDPSAGSPTETLLRLLLPLSDKVH